MMKMCQSLFLFRVYTRQIPSGQLKACISRIDSCPINRFVGRLYAGEVFGALKLMSVLIKIDLRGVFRGCVVVLRL